MFNKPLHEQPVVLKTGLERSRGPFLQGTKYIGEGYYKDWEIEGLWWKSIKIKRFFEFFWNCLARIYGSKTFCPTF